MPAGNYGMAFIAALVGGTVYLSLGQMIVGLVKTPETVNVTTRLVFFLFIMVGQFASFGAFSETITNGKHNTSRSYHPFTSINEASDTNRNINKTRISILSW